jgi:phosphate:Na+ symporter
LKIFLSIFAGLGLFFIGIRLMADHLQQIAGRKMRRLVGRSMTHQLSGAVFGLTAGAVMQSTNAVIQMLGTLVSAGVMDTRKAFPVINWANLGTSMILLLSLFSMNLLVLTLIGLTGVAYFFRLNHSVLHRHWVKALLGIGLLFLGIDFIKHGSSLLKEAGWLKDYIFMSGGSHGLNFLVGFVVTLLVQSSSIITVVAMSVVSVGLLDLGQGVVIVLGASLASGVNAWMLGNNLTGYARQLVFYQLILKVLGVAATGLLLILEALTGLPLLMTAIQLTGISPAFTLAVIYMLVQVISDLVAHPFHHTIEHALTRLSPPTEIEVVGKPHYLSDHALGEPQSALVLVEREQEELLAKLPDFINPLREDSVTPAYKVESLHDAGQKVAAECAEFLTNIADQHHSRDVLERVVLLRQRNELIRSLQEVLRDLYLEIQPIDHGESAQQLLHGMLESLHLLLLTLSEAQAEWNPEDMEILRSLTHDRSEMMDSIRRRFIGMEHTLSKEAQQSIFAVTMHFERVVWLLRRYVLLLDQSHLTLDL